MNFTESWSRKAFFKSLYPNLSKFSQKGSLIKSCLKKEKKRKKKKRNRDSITTTHFKVRYLSCMLSFSFSAQWYINKARINCCCLVWGFFLLFLPPFPRKGTGQGHTGRTLKYIVNQFSKGRKKMMKGTEKTPKQSFQNKNNKMTLKCSQDCHMPL